MCDVPILPKGSPHLCLAESAGCPFVCSTPFQFVEADFSTDYLAPAALELLFSPSPAGYILIPEDSGKRKADRMEREWSLHKPCHGEDIPWSQKERFITPRKQALLLTASSLLVASIWCTVKRRGFFVLESVLPETSRGRRRRKKNHKEAISCYPWFLERLDYPKADSREFCQAGASLVSPIAS